MNAMEDLRAKRQQAAEEIVFRLQSCADRVFVRHPVSVAYLYGSVQRKNPLPTSDVDIAIVFSETLSAYDRLVLELKIQAELEDVCDLTAVDVRSIDQAPIMVQGPIVQEGLRLYERNKAERVAFEVMTRKKYFDYLPTAERMQKAFLNHVRNNGLF